MSITERGMQMYKCLKKGWIPLAEYAEKNSLNVYARNKLIIELNKKYKEQIGRTWVILEEEANKI